MKKQIALTLIISISIVSLGTEVLIPKARLTALPGQPVIESLVPLSADEAAIQKWKLEAQQFDAAIKEIEGILRLDLSTKEGSEQAEKIIKRNERKMDFAKAKIASASLKFPAFRKAVEEEAKKYGGNEKFAEAFNRDASIAKGIPGLQEVAKEMEAGIQPAITILKRVQAAFEKHAKKQDGQTSSMRFDSPTGNYFFAKAAYTPTACAIEPTAMSFSARANFCQSLGISVSKSICNIIAGVIMVFIGAIAAHLDCINPCIDSAISKRVTCHQNANKFPFPVNVIARNSCDETFVKRVTTCLVDCD
jgi:hypothetical protein